MQADFSKVYKNDTGIYHRTIILHTDKDNHDPVYEYLEKAGFDLESHEPLATMGKIYVFGAALTEGEK